MSDEQYRLKPEKFDDPAALMRDGIDLDISASASTLPDNIDLDDRAAVERIIFVCDEYRRDPKVFSRFIDACISLAAYRKVQKLFSELSREEKQELLRQLQREMSTIDK
jgi:hypothetical protein